MKGKEEEKKKDLNKYWSLATKLNSLKMKQEKEGGNEEVKKEKGKRRGKVGKREKRKGRGREKRE